uniref:hypothetical protein n=1 Tax=Pseudomonas brenneri TaxID=129817 RepID=UPI003BA325CB
NISMLITLCSPARKSEQKQLNTWVSFQSAEQPLLGQFSVSGNMARIVAYVKRELYDRQACRLATSARIVCFGDKFYKIHRVVSKLY